MFVYRRLSRNLTFLFALLAFLPLLAQPADAQPLKAGDFELGFGVGGTRFDEALSEDDADYRTEIRGGYFLNDAFELELQATDSAGILDLTLYTAFVNAVFNFQNPSVAVPYILVGAGGAKLENYSLFNSADEFDETGLAYQAAIGSRFFFGQDSRMALRVELSTTFEETLDETNQHTGLTAGLLWRIGR